MTEANSHRRLMVIGVLVVALFGGLLARLWFLQVAGGEQLAVAAQRQRDQFVTVPAVRGTVYDRNGIVLAQTVPITTLVVDRQQLSQTERATLQETLGGLLGKTADEIDALIDNQQYDPFESVPIAEDITLEQAMYVTEHRAEFPEVSVDRSAARRYPNDFQAADVVGYLGEVNDDELEAHQGDGYEPGDAIGKTGVEAIYESELRGKPGRKKVEVDNQNRAVNEVEVSKPRAGRDVRLTLDLPTQQMAEESLIQGMEGARGLSDRVTGSFKANAGAVVVLDARTGSVVAMASNPGFNPNDFIAGTADRYFEDPDNPLINRALTPYAPGSTFKTFTAIAMLQSGLFDDGAEHVISESPPGCFEFGNDEQRCNAGKAVLGPRALRSALTVSSDVYFYSVGNQFWNRYRDEGIAAKNTDSDVAGDLIPDEQHPVGNAMQHLAREYGFGESTGLGLGDQAGIIPNHEYRVKLNPDNAEAQFWRRGDAASLAVGQGDVLVTPLQLANAYAAFANGGTLFQPRLASEVTLSSAGLPAGQLGAPVHTLEPIVKRTTGLAPEVRQPIVDGLDGVIYSGDGTAAGVFADYEGVHLIGKTGTAEVQGKQDTSWFVAVTNPEGDPLLDQYVVVAMVEQGGFGASVAAPIVRRVIDFLNNRMDGPAPVVVKPATGNEASN